MSSKKTSAKAGLSRRGFLQGLGASAAVAVSAPNILRADEAAKPVILGTGDHRYEWVKGWATLPEGKKFGNAHAVQVDSQGRFFIHNQSKDSVCIFDPDGKFIKSWGPEYAGGAHGMQLRKEGNTEFLYLSTTGQRHVVKTTLDGEVVFKIGYPKECPAYKGEGQYSPTNLAIAPNGDIYVGDGYGSSFIHQYSAKGEYIKSWGGGGKAPGKMSCPHGIALDTRGAEPILVVADRSNRRLQNFKLDGTHINFVTEELRSPCHFDIHNGDLLIPDLEGRVTLFDKNNKLICHLGDNPNPGKRGGPGNRVPQAEWKDGIFHTPHGACFDKDGNIYVTEWLAPVGRVTKLKKLA